MSEDIRPLIEEFADLFYRQRDPAAAFAAHVGTDYIQHSPILADGREAALAMLVPLFAQPGARFTVHRILIDGNMAALHIHGCPDPALPGKAVVDFYRVAGGKIVEHWDVVQPLPTASRNANGPF